MSPSNDNAIIVGIDGSKNALAAVSWAAIEAARRHLPLTLLHGIIAPIEFGPGIAFDQFDYDIYRRDGGAALETAREAAAAAAAPLGDIDIITDLIQAPPIPALRDRSKNARMLVVGTRGLGAFGRGILGSVSTALARHAECPVAVIPQTYAVPERPGRVIVGVDGSPASTNAVEIAFDQASHRGAELVAVLTWTELLRYLPRHQMQQEAEELVAQALAGYCETYPDVPVSRIVVEDRPAKRLLETGEHAELIVVGSHGRGGFAGMTLGSVSQAVLHGAQVPIIIARTRS
ncbi:MULTISPECIES: universal stress protein [Nocardia]|uniref:universal stress protein n=1 Tax=Nocardia TaxID=1817 RepID=UPI000D688E38|nr:MULTISPECIES: universal stress protein [Nocardia]